LFIFILQRLSLEKMTKAETQGAFGHGYCDSSIFADELMQADKIFKALFSQRL